MDAGKLTYSVRYGRISAPPPGDVTIKERPRLDMTVLQNAMRQNKTHIGRNFFPFIANFRIELFVIVSFGMPLLDKLDLNKLNCCFLMLIWLKLPKFVIKIKLMKLLDNKLFLYGEFDSMSFFLIDC